MRILILGAGITGLSLAQQLRGQAEVLVIEGTDRIGGLAKTKQVDGVTYHMVGGHCFNSKHKEVLDFVFSLLPKEQCHLVKRISRIQADGYEIDYPIEFSIRQIFAQDPTLAQAIVRDFLASNDDGIYENLEVWFRKKFGNTLAEYYFLPYNTKIWGRAPREMSHTWVEDKLPIPDKASFFASLMQTQQDTMSHATFYYPNTNDQQTLYEALATGVDIVFNEYVTKIEKTSEGWRVNDRYEADILVSTLPLNLLPSYLIDAPQDILDLASLLRYNKVSNILWESQPTEKTWSYLPHPNSLFHRYIHIGSYFEPAKGYTITEAVGERSYDELVACGMQDPFLIRPLDYHVSDHAYVVFDENRDRAVNGILAYLNTIGLYSIGRFGRWDYYNMDICIKQTMDIYKELKAQL
ncbi:MAG: FAD-dependent oxidoreductase [Bacteroidales bacterium]|nr:FAD-dependent oxidoreductase [Bacteroidales bacterium]